MPEELTNKERLPLLISDLRAAQEGMTEDERTAFWGALMEGYCQACGRKDDYPGYICPCENDE